MNKELYESALSGPSREFYLQVFKEVEEGRLFRAAWNWEAFFFGPFWYFNRRFTTLSVVRRLFLFVLIKTIRTDADKE
ncbi:hypothetical protein BST96_04985 [Oceanicoccus sagamiensis]|uniref:Uncharacterized protein n=1 Tax=Oceanicoccus sagamiensis TaxID=716816 RepID=A0A1X9N606_9GAMM|nr:hypothetical protein BST96_04985 [Oceanicoccus sagamiensis]